ncbi:MAG: GtrA family protein [Patescibacteria group bacterium]|nr:GtrA family protein [Patescibacteria group bacterium]
MGVKVIDTKGLYRFARYTAIGVSTFALDLGMLYLLTIRGINYLLAVACGFTLGVSVNYALSRPLVFAKTERPYHHGYAYFLGVGVVALVAVVSLTGVLVSLFGVPLFPARIAVAGIVGFAGYLFNLHYNFKVAGKH